MGDMSLQDVMNTVARQLDGVALRSTPSSRTILSELEIFASVDPLLGDLQRQYKDARYTRRMQEEMFGADDPMADVARDVEDSAWCAMQTRYMEVRADRALMRDVQAIQKEAREEEIRIKERERRNEALRTYYQSEMMRHINERRKSPVIFEWLIVLWIFEKINRSLSLRAGFTKLAA